jgi:serine protease
MIAATVANQLVYPVNLQAKYNGDYTTVPTFTSKPRVYVIFWGAQWKNFSGNPAGMDSYIKKFYAGLGTNGEKWSGIMTQYCYPNSKYFINVPSGATRCSVYAKHIGYPSGGALAGAWYDTSVNAPYYSSSFQIGLEAVKASIHFKLKTQAQNNNVQYVIVSPSQTHPDGFGFSGPNSLCADHNDITNGKLDLAYVNLPYIPDMGAKCGANSINYGPSGYLDGVSIVASHEYAETLTDARGTGWYNNNADEIGDTCRGINTVIDLKTGRFPVQAIWSNDQHGCSTDHRIVRTRQKTKVL